MADKINPGIGGNTPQERRLAAIERFLSPFRKAMIRTKDQTGRLQSYEILANYLGVAKDPPVENPFRLLINKDKWQVSSYGSTILDGTNGDKIAVGKLDTDFSGDGSVAVKITISDGEVGSAEITVGSFGSEVVMDSATPPSQIEAWLFIGRVEKDGNAFILHQGVTSAQVLVNGFYNGSLVRVFAQASPASDSLVIPE